MVGCQSKPSVVGKWDSSISGVATTFEFTQDGKIVNEANAMGIAIKATGTYQQTDTELKITINSVEAPSAPKPVQDMIKTQAKVGTEMVSKLTFTNADAFELEVSGQKQSFTRKKS